MDKEYSVKRFKEVLDFLPEKISKSLAGLGEEIKCETEEIRLRAGRPLAITVRGSQFFVGKTATMMPKDDSLKISEREVEECFVKLCNRSVYSHTDELREGYLILNGGHRAGVCGTVTVEQGKIQSVRDISSINIRIAKEVPHFADQIVKDYTGGGILVCGGPGSGKTTLIRDMVRGLAGGVSGRFFKVAVIDSRGELAAVSGGVPMTDIGQSADIITACPKEKGIEIALRTLYPDVIAFDEIGNLDEVRAVEQGLNCGVSIITSAHIGSKQDLFKKEQTKRLLQSGAIDKVVICEKKNGFRYSVYDQKELEKVRV